jgi:tRNA1(Val) A37 N6-methylase TrmN6
MDRAEIEVTEGRLLGGTVRYRQGAVGHRTGIEPVMLAAFVPARGGERVIEAGTGAGAGLLCLARRVPGISGLGVDQDAALVALAAGNFADNGFTGLHAAVGDVVAGDEVFDHAMANPPWFPPGTPSPDGRRERARRAAGDVATAWTRKLAARLRHKGTLSFIVPAAGLPDYLAAMTEAGVGGASIFPLWPRAGRPAKLILLQGARGGRDPLRLAAGLVLHDSEGRFTAAAEAVLRQGSALARADQGAGSPITGVRSRPTISSATSATARSARSGSRPLATMATPLPPGRS